MEALFQFIDNSILLLEDISNELENEKLDIIEFLSSNLKTEGLIINGRVKSSKSLREKIIRKDYCNRYSSPESLISDLPDIIGIRILCLLRQDEEAIFDKFKKLFTEPNDAQFKAIPDTINETVPYLVMDLPTKPDTMVNGKKIYKISGRWVTGEQYKNVEIQIKSLTNMLWGEIEHMLFYKNYSYILNNNYYNKMMDSTYDLLNVVDKQLTIFQNALRVDEQGLIEEIKSMVAKFIYIHYDSIIRGVLGCQVDLRKVYDIVVDLLYFRKNVYSAKQAMEMANEILLKIGSKREFINTDIFRFERYKTLQSNELRMLGEQLDKLARINVYWKCLVGIFHLLEGTDYTRSIDSLVQDCLGLFKGISDYFEDMDNPGIPVLKEGCISGLIDAFCLSQSIDYFSANSRIIIIDILQSFIIENQISFILDQGEYSSFDWVPIKQMIGITVSLSICSNMAIPIDRDCLVHLKELITDIESPWKPNVDIRVLDDLLRDELKLDISEVRLFLVSGE